MLSLITLHKTGKSSGCSISYAAWCVSKIYPSSYLGMYMIIGM